MMRVERPSKALHSLLNHVASNGMASGTSARGQICMRQSARRSLSLFRLRDLVRWQKRQCCKGGSCVRHEHPPPGLAVVAAMFMIIIERIRPPAFPVALIDLTFPLIGLQPACGPFQARMVCGQSRLTKRISD